MPMNALLQATPSAEQMKGFGLLSLLLYFFLVLGVFLVSGIVILTVKDTVTTG